MGTIVRGKIIRSDVAWWDGKTATATRVDATGGTVSGLQLNDYVDVLQVYGSGSNKTLGTIASATSHIGSTTCTLVFGPGTWTITDDITIGSNFTVYVAAGAVFSVSAGKTLTLSGPVLREAITWTSGSGTVTNSVGAATLIDITDSGANFNATTVEAALAEFASTSTGEGASIIGIEDSAGNYTATNVETAFTELFDGATQTKKGLVELATSAEIATGTDTGRVPAIDQLKASADVGWERGTFSVTWDTGFSSPPTINIEYFRMGRLVLVWTDAVIAATSNAATFRCTSATIPAAIRPAASRKMLASVRDNGNWQFGIMVFNSDGTIYVHADAQASDGFTTSGTKGLQSFLGGTYNLGTSS